MARLARTALLVAAAVAVAFTLGRSITRFNDSEWGKDLFFNFWYFSYHSFVRHDAAPYALAPGQAADLVFVTWADTAGLTLPPVAPFLTPYTPPLVLLLAPLSWLAWPWASALFALLNGVLALVCAWLTVRLSGVATVSRWALALMGLVALGFIPTRNTIGVGQPALLVFALMLAARLWEARRPWWAGVALGVALSKYSLALPVVIWFALRRRWAALAVALGVQALGVVVMAALTGVAPWRIVLIHLEMTLRLAGSEGIHLGRWLAHAPGWSLAVGALYTAVLALGLARWLPRFTRRETSRAANLAVITALHLWAVLVVYHREYDAVVYILYMGLVVVGLEAGWWRLRRAEQAGLGAWSVAATLWLGRPGLTVAEWLPEPAATWYLDYAQLGTTLALLGGSLLAVGLLYRLRGADQPASRAT